MSIAAVLASGSRSAQSAASTTWNGTLTGPDPFGANFTAAQAQCPAAVAGTLANYYIGIGSNARASTNVVWTVVNNGSNTAITLTVGPGLTGIFSDTSHSASIAQNDLIHQIAVSGAETASVQASGHGINFTPTSGNTAFAISATGANSVGITASGTGPLTTYMAFGGVSTVNATVGNAQITMPVAGLTQYLYAFVSVNGRSSTSTHKLNINGSVGNQVVSFAAGVTGLVKDTTHTDAVVAGDLLVSQIDLGTGTGNLTMTSIGVWNVATTDGQSAVGLASTGGFAVSAGTSIANPVTGRLNGNATESLSQGGLPPCTASKLWTNVSVNASTTNSTLKFRKGAANGNQVVTITALTTGPFQDTTNSDAVIGSDLVDYQVTGATTGSVTFTAISMLFTVAGGAVAKIMRLPALGAG